MTEGTSQPHNESNLREPAGFTERDLTPLGPEVPCPYLPGRVSQNEAYLAPKLSGADYLGLMNFGFRRSGRAVYRPRCVGCNACRPLRVLTARFEPTKSQRRVIRRNLDIRFVKTRPTPTQDRFDLYVRYLEFQHDSSMTREFGSFVNFLYDSPTDTIEFLYLLDDELVGVSICDVCPTGLSSVYMYFDPAHAQRSLGTWSALAEIEFCRRQGFPYYFLGYYVEGCRKMEYKARFRPNEILTEDGAWMPFRT